jgi:AraC family transcriptional regulator
MVMGDWSRLLFHSPSLRMGMFRCPVTHPGFETAGSIDSFHLCFPRTAVWLQYEDTPRFVADASRATLYNPNQAFARSRISPEGDHTDWIALGDTVARDVVAHFSPDDAQADLAFRFRMATVCPAIYRAQRSLFNEIERGLDDRLEVEERAIGIVSRILASAYAGSRRRPGNTGSPRPLVECAREAILESLFENLGVAEIAGRLNVSVFHLCRVFRASTGLTLHAYRRDMRLRAALGLVPRHRGRLSSLALGMGFSSHAHFTAAFRRAFGVAPSEEATAMI